jgi:hypothetical protein
MDQREQRLIDLLEELNAMWAEATGFNHPTIDCLLDPQQRRSDATRNYLTATASGTLRDRIFSAFNHDHEPPEGFDDLNERYQTLLHEAVELANALGLPAARDGGWRPREIGTYRMSVNRRSGAACAPWTRLPT